MEKVAFKGETIKLGQFLKLAGLVDTGGEAKTRINSGEVKVNGEVDTRRGRQLRPGDQVELAGSVVLAVGITGD